MGRPSTKKAETNVDPFAGLDDATRELVMKMVAEEIAKRTVVPAKQEAEEDFIVVPENAKIEVSSNIVGTFILKDNIEHPTVNITFGKYGDKIRMTMAEAMAVARQKEKIFGFGMLAIKRVICDDKRVKLEHVYDELKVSDLYGGQDMLTPNNIDSLFKSEVTLEEFTRKINARPQMYEIVLEIAYEKYRKGYFNDNAKMSFFRQTSNNDNLFR